MRFFSLLLFVLTVVSFIIIFLICKGQNTGLGGSSLAGSWQIDGNITLPICSPMFEGHVAVVRLELSSGNGVSVKLYLESMLQLSSFGVDLMNV